MSLKTKLSERQKELVRQFFICEGNKAEAFRRAGYKGDANKLACLMFNKPHIKRAIAKQSWKVEKKYEVTKEWIIERLKKIADSNNILNKFIKIAEDGSLYWDFKEATKEDLSYIQNLAVEIYLEGRGKSAKRVKKFKPMVINPHEALITLSRIIGAFNDKLTVEGELSIIDRLNQGRKQVSPKKEEDSV